MRAGVEPYGPVQDTMFRALGVLRFVVLVNAVGIYVVRASGYDHPRVGYLVMAFMAVWTLFVVWAYAAPPRRRPWLLVADLLVAVVAIGLSPYVKGESMQATLPGFWVMGVVLAWAILWRWAGGLTAAVVVSVADLAVRGEFTQQAYGNIFLLVLGGAIVGFLSGLLQQTARERDVAQRAAASATERQRLARVVHDGVLQALALVQRRAPDFGPEGADLGRLAGEQEVRLRALVQQDSLDLATPGGDQDLAQRLSALQTRHVHVAVPGAPATLPAATAAEVVAAVEACLSNVRHHVGPDAEAWVLLEELGDRWVVSVRDDGPGIPEGRLQASAAEGRLGVQQSIVGRMQDLGGTATVRTAPGQGTEWELAVPRRHPLRVDA
jgi:glucose-6-phosphate-specific signal transduction histidine kinase